MTMRLPVHALWVLGLSLFGAAACDDGGAADDGAGGAAGADGATTPDAGGEAAAISALRLDVDTVDLEIGAHQALVLTAERADGTTEVVTARASWTTSAAAVVTVDAGVVTAVTAGEADVAASLEGQTATLHVLVAEPRLTSVEVRPGTLAMDREAEQQLTAFAVYSDGHEVEVTTEATWASSDDALLGFDADRPGMALGHAAGEVTVTATWLEQAGTATVTVECAYPRFPAAVRYGTIMPPLAWDGAYNPDGSQFDFSLRDVYCGDTYKDYSVVIFVVGAGWCSACTLYTRRLDPQAEAIDQAGGLLVYLEAQDSNYGPANNAFAHQHITHLIGDGIGIRVGDVDTQPTRNFLLDSQLVTAFPTVFVVRRRDMRIIAVEGRSQYPLSLEAVALDPEADWSNPGPPPFVNRCGDGDDEIYEPDNTPAQAAEIGAGSFEGGICDSEPDYYQVNLQGEWRLSVEFSHATGDIDVFVWDAGQDQPVQRGGNPVGGDSSTDNETFTHAGPALVRVYGYAGASAPYRLTLEAL